MANYYYVGTILPPLSLDSQPEIPFEKLETLLRDNLSECDFEKTLALRKFYDIVNLRALWREEEFDSRGQISDYEMREALISQSYFPPYVFAFIERYPKIKDRLHHFPYLLSKAFSESESDKDPFLREYLSFEREVRLVMTAFRAKRMGRDLNVEFQYEDPDEDLIAQLLAQQDANVYEPPEKYKDLKLIFDKHGDDPMALQKAIDQYRFDKTDQLVDMADTFSIERILAYLVQFMIVEKWSEIDKEKGTQIVDRIIA